MINDVVVRKGSSLRGCGSEWIVRELDKGESGPFPAGYL
jgi:hypothetical protein